VRVVRVHASTDKEVRAGLVSLISLLLWLYAQPTQQHELAAA
jgi:hypothetical protein